MKIRILTSCTGDKRHKPENALTQADFEQIDDAETFGARERELANTIATAETMYSGSQHVRLMDGVRAYREREAGDLDLWVLSAGYGLIPGSREIAPYECTFQGMRPSAIEAFSTRLGVPEAARRLFALPADLTIVLLGDDYLRALQLDEAVCFASPTLFLTSEGAKRHIRGQGTKVIVPLTNQEAKRFSYALVGLKGELAKRLLALIANQGETLVSALLAPEADLLALLDAGGPDIKSVKRAPAQANPNVDVVISIPSTWWEKPHRQKLRYFIPEWDDLVDPDYDFETDTHSGGTGDWSNEVYAHQMYPEPNYDGILVSKVVAEKSVKKKERINRLGVHRFLRVPREFPIMGDCGAFGYIMEEIPPYTTAEILDYYTRLDFDYGVSIDHLIVTATMEQKKFRYDLTIHNAEEFLREHRKAGLPWEPIGAVQGWDPKSYADAARQYVAMGYKYIALGGLVRSSTKDILRILEAVQPFVPATVNVHLFGIARMNMFPDFARLGVRSIDSASYLRRAWMGSGGENYLTDQGFYTAIRIPEAGKSFRAKRMVTEGGIRAEHVVRLERECLRVLDEFDRGCLSSEKCLDVIEEYDRLITTNRIDIRPRLERTLDAKPWKACPCEICRRDGIQVILFRGNNRNRRRGFHNTFIFYRLVQRIMAGETVSLIEEEPEVLTEQLSLFPDAMSIA